MLDVGPAINKLWGGPPVRAGPPGPALRLGIKERSARGAQYFATVACPSPDKLPATGIHRQLRFDFSCRWALSFKMEMKSAAPMNASYSSLSSSLISPSLARQARMSILAWTAGSTRNPATRCAEF